MTEETRSARRSSLTPYVSDRTRQVIDDAIRSGRLLPTDREAAEVRAAEDPVAFEAELDRASFVVEFGEVGSDADAPMPAIELGPRSGLSEAARRIHLAEAAINLNRAAGSLSDRDYPTEGDLDHKWKAANRARKSLYDLADFVLERLPLIARRRGAVRRGRRPGRNIPRDVFVGRMGRAVTELRRKGFKVTQLAVATQMELAHDTFRDYLEPGDWPPN